METAIVVFTRDLRLRDNPALASACAQAERVVPVFVLDKALTTAPNQTRFLLDSLACVRDGLRERGGDLVIRQGEPVAEVIQLAGEAGARAVFIADDVSGYAARRRGRLESECARHRLELIITPGLTVVPPGELRPAGGDHYKVFTPYWRAWSAEPWREVVHAPVTLRLPSGVQAGRIPPIGGNPSPGLMQGGERAGLSRAHRWLHDSLAVYGDHHDDLAGDRTSRLSAYLRFGCISPLDLAREARGRAGGAEFCRQLAWRDFFHQVTAAFPEIARADYRPRDARPRDARPRDARPRDARPRDGRPRDGRPRDARPRDGRPAGGEWREDRDALQAWRDGRTGVPIVDAGMRQLTAEGYMHNRARMITASFLTRNLAIDWRHGYRHFLALLADGDVANNAGNWQWVAGTGNDTRPNRVMNITRQARRFDPAGDYVRRYVTELAGLDAADVHAPWKLAPGPRRRLGYPDPIVELS